MVVPLRLVLLVTEILDGFEIQQTIDANGHRPGLFSHHLSTKLCAPLGKEKREKYVARNRNKYDANILERISIAKVKTNDKNFEECWPDIKGKQANNLLHSSGATFYRTGQAAGMSIKVETHAQLMQVLECPNTDGTLGKL